MQTSAAYPQSNAILLHPFLPLCSPLTHVVPAPFVIFFSLFFPPFLLELDGGGEPFDLISSLAAAATLFMRLRGVNRPRSLLCECEALKTHVRLVCLEVTSWKYAACYCCCCVCACQRVCVCVCTRASTWVRARQDNIMHLHAALQRWRMSLIYNRDERSVHLIKRHIGTLLHSIG